MKTGAKAIEESDLSFSLFMPGGLAWIGRSGSAAAGWLEVRESRASIYMQTSELHSDLSSASV
jgi:hypothetical protein